MRAKSVHKILQKPVLKTGVHSTIHACQEARNRDTGIRIVGADYVPA